MKQRKSLMKWQNLGIIKSSNQIGPPVLGGKASFSGEKNEKEHPRPCGGNEWHNLENQNNEECKLKLRNANWNAIPRGTPPLLWEGRGQKTGDKRFSNLLLERISLKNL